MRCRYRNSFQTSRDFSFLYQRFIARALPLKTLAKSFPLGLAHLVMEKTMRETRRAMITVGLNPIRMKRQHLWYSRSKLASPLRRWIKPGSMSVAQRVHIVCQQ
jgi:hypothetical protein